MSFASNRPTHELLVGSSFSRLSLINIDRGTILKELAMSESNDAMFLQPFGDRSIAIATSKGAVQILDNRAWQSTAHFSVQAGPFSSFSVLDDRYIVTSGFLSGRGVLDVVDLRVQALLGSIPAPCHLLKTINVSGYPKLMGVTETGFHFLDPPKLSIASSQSFEPIYDLMEDQSVPPLITSVDSSLSEDLLVFGDANGKIFLWSKGEEREDGIYPIDEPLVNPLSDPVEVPSAILYTQSYPWDDDIPFSEFGLPFYDDLLLSGDWPRGRLHSVGLPPASIDSSLLSTAKDAGDLSFVPKPPGMHQNQWPYKKAPEVARFKSSQSIRNKARSASRGRNSRTRSKSSSDRSRSHSPIPTVDDYKLMEIIYSRFGVQDFDFRFYNKSNLGGFESSVSQSYLNNYLQTLYFIHSFRMRAILHSMDPDCSKELCLLCETGFLFRMLEQSNGIQCRASNWSSVFSHVKETQIMNLRENQAIPFPSYSTTIQLCSRFLFDHFQRDAVYSVDDFRYQVDVNSTCSECAESRLKTCNTFSVDLQYPGARQVGIALCCCKLVMRLAAG
jgi:PAB-dependent poly(A)-specific ribonuclease subunit 2